MQHESTVKPKETTVHSSGWGLPDKAHERILGGDGSFPLTDGALSHAGMSIYQNPSGGLLKMRAFYVV